MQRDDFLGGYPSYSYPRPSTLNFGVKSVTRVKIRLFRCFRGFPRMLPCLRRLAHSFVSLPLSKFWAPSTLGFGILLKICPFRDSRTKSGRRVRDEDFSGPSAARLTAGIRRTCAQETPRGCPPPASKLPPTRESQRKERKRKEGCNVRLPRGSPAPVLLPKRPVPGSSALAPV